MLNIITIIELITAVPIILLTKNPIVVIGPSILLSTFILDEFYINLMMCISFFAIWKIALICLGFTVIYGVDKLKTYKTIFGLWFAFVLFLAVFMTRNNIQL